MIRAKITAGPERLGGLDMLRGFAALGVALYHFDGTQQYFVDSYGTVDRAVTPSLSFEFGRYGVDLFFMISGFVIFMTLERSARIRDFAVSRFARLYPAFWTALIVAIIAVWLDGRPTPTFNIAVANATMLPGLFGAPLVDGVYWTLAYELLFYVLAAGFFLTGSRKPELACLGWLLASVLTMAYAPPAAIKAIAGFYSYLFIAGIMIYRLRQNPRNLFAWAVLATAIFVSGRVPFAFFNEQHISGLPNGAIACACAAAMWFGARRRPPQFLAYLGEISYALYLIHDQVGWGLLHAVAPLRLPADLSIAVALLAVIGLAGVINTRIERPAQRWIKDRYARATRARELRATSRARTAL
jgi:peptidoglycan/LPS O-acetylase OafA/YrhL